ncbi:MAG: hypothetical protein V4805_17240 [Pseudomonadota bacterium]
MKILASTIDLSATHLATSRSEVHETLRAWVGNERPDFEGRGRPSSVTTISAAARDAMQNAQAAQAAATAAAPSAEAAAIQDAADNVEKDPMLMLLRSMVEMLTGHKIALTSSRDFQVNTSNPAITAPDQAAPPPPKRAGFGLEYDRHETLDQSEHTHFQAEGEIHTSDGKSIKFSLQLDMRSASHQESNVSIRAGDGVKKDPLVINLGSTTFGGTAAQLQSQRFQFDLDADGKAEDVPLLAGNSGFLALDLNGNDKIDNGRELFGAGSGNGFADLAQYDSDGNGWIDESDPIFQQLKVWMPSADTAGSISTLKDKNVGALFLGQTATPFSFKDGNQQELGAVRASGLYLTESGSAGSLQQIDLVV